MAPRYYTISDSPISEHDIEVTIPLKADRTEQDDDWLFVQALRKRVLLSKGSRKSIEAFLSYQLKLTPSTQEGFLKHTRSLVLANAHELQPYRKAAGDVLEWADNQGVKAAPLTRTESKTDPEFDAIIKDKRAMADVLKKLEAKEIISRDGEWRGIKSKKTELVALVILLSEEGILKNLSKAQLGRVFSKKFKCDMNERNYTASPKADTLERVRVEIGL